MTYLRISLTTGLLAALLVVCADPRNQAFAGFFDGNKLYSRCTSSDIEDMKMCMGYISGISDAIQSYKFFDASRFNPEEDDSLYYIDICQPLGRTIGQVTDIVISWLKKKPERRHYTAASLV